MRFLLAGLLALCLAPAASARDAGTSSARRPAARPAADPCRKPPADRTVIKVNLKPDTEVAELLNWFSATTCTPILASTGTPLAGKKVTILAPKPITIAEARRLFHDALASVGLAAEQNGRFLQIIDAARARKGVTPVSRPPR